MLAGLGFGSLFAALAQIPEGPASCRWRSTSWWRPRSWSLAATAAAVELGPARAGRPRPARSAAPSAPLATGAFLLATQHGCLTVTSVLASLYPAFTVLLAATVLREHVHRAQAVGLVLCGVAVAFVAAG